MANHTDINTVNSSYRIATHLAHPEVLLVDSGSDAETYATLLREHCPTVTLMRHKGTAVQYLRRATPALVLTGIHLEDGSAIEICVAAKSSQLPASVLVISDTPRTCRRC